MLVTTYFHRSTVKVNTSTYQHYFIGFHSIISLLWVNGCRNFVHQHFFIYFHSIFSLLLWKSMATATVFLPTFFQWLPYKKKKKALLWMSVVTATVPQHCFNDFHSICPRFSPKSVSSNSSKYHLLCSTEERNSYRFGTVAAFHKTIGYGRAGMVIYKMNKNPMAHWKHWNIWRGGGQKLNTASWELVLWFYQTLALDIRLYK